MIEPGGFVTGGGQWRFLSRYKSAKITTMTHIHTLTGLRGIAALIVFISHAANENLLPAVLGHGFGQVGVMLFFVLSGFLMAHLYIHKAFTADNVLDYAKARIGRVFPLYITLILFSYLLSKYLFPGFYFSFSGFSQLLSALLFVKAPYVFWTIPVEVQFYVIFIGFWCIYQRQANLAVLAGFALLTVTPTLAIYLSSGTLPRIVSLYSFSFFIGVFTSLAFNRIHNNSAYHKLANLIGFPAVVLLFMNLPAVRLELGLVYDDFIFLRTWGDPVTWLLVYATFLCAVFNSKGLSFLNWRPFVVLGELSYGFYLIHYPVLIHTSTLVTQPQLRLLASGGVALVLAYLFFRFFERPSARLIRNLGAGQRR